MNTKNAADGNSGSPPCYLADLGELRAALSAIKKINDMPLAEIQFIDGGEHVEVTDEQREEWRFIGVTNSMLAEMFLME